MPSVSNPAENEYSQRSRKEQPGKTDTSIRRTSGDDPLSPLSVILLYLNSL